MHSKTLKLPMKTRPIPRTNLTASVLCLGTAEFGSGVDDATAEQIIETYLDAGGNVLDTAEIYAAWLKNGEHRSETCLGTWLRKHKNRDGLIISTKGAHPRLNAMDKPRMSKSIVESDLDSSLQRLGIDCVDIYWLHRDDPGTPVEEIVLMLEEFRKAGKIRHKGLSNWTLPRAEAARVAAEKLGVEGFIGIQNQWSLAKADASKGDPTWAYTDDSFFEWHLRHNIAAFPYTTQANGYFRRLENGTIDQASDLVKRLFHSPENDGRFKRIKALQAETGLTVGAIVLGYLLAQPFPVFPLIGPKKVADLLESIESAQATLTPEDIAFLTATR
jgi:aryl-alcohol dehydrogenase-like predicted oxidoreductase